MKNLNKNQYKYLRSTGKTVLIILMLVVSVSAAVCQSLNLNGLKDKLINSKTKLTTKPQLDEQTIIAGLKEALNVGTKNAVSFVSKQGGYLQNAAIKIPLPPDLQDVADKVSKIGLKKKVDEFIETMNEAAEKAAPKAVDIFVSAVKKMTVQDALNILHGANDAATRYFEKQTRSQLYQLFQPVVSDTMNKVGVTSLYKSIMNAYNQIPLVKKKNFDLDQYVTNKALDGLFYMVAGEEAKIRKDPVARVTDLLKKVFG